jgi:glycosyltransferase involved in cell wall biosynthesis
MSLFPAKKVSVLIASTLKPILDVRAFGKLALSLGETNKYRLFIIGFSLKRPTSVPDFRFYSSMTHFDSRVDRLMAQGRFLVRLLKIRPKILICCTYELLPIASFLKSILGYKIIYDVQENYCANLDLNPSLSINQKVKASNLIRKAESVHGIDLFLLAEKCYTDEMPKKHPYLILENKYQGQIKKTGPKTFEGKNKIRFCITGTITPAFGTWDAICWFEAILKRYPDAELEIVGHCPVDSFQKQLMAVAKRIPNLILRIDRIPIGHSELLEVVAKSDFALLPYQNHTGIRNKMPTKLFECAALGVPVLISPNVKWEDFLAEFDGGYALDFLDLPQAVNQLNAALSLTFFTTMPTEDILWTTEKSDFQQAVQNLLP